MTLPKIHMSFFCDIYTKLDLDVITNFSNKIVNIIKLDDIYISITFLMITDILSTYKMVMLFILDWLMNMKRISSKLVGMWFLTSLKPFTQSNPTLSERLSGHFLMMLSLKT